MMGSAKRLMAGVAGWTMVLALAACGGNDDVTISSPASGVAAITGGASGSCSDLSMPILAGQTLLAGTAKVAAIGDELVVAVYAAPDWSFSAVHIYVGQEPVPVNASGIPAPGQFPYNQEFDPAATTYELRLALADLGVGCGDELVGAIHLEMTGVDPETGETVTETGWAFGPNPFDGPRWGWWFDVEICCEEPPPADGCTLTQGYWKNHNSYRSRPSQQQPWPLSEDELLCGSSWLDILRTAPRGNAWVILAHQWIAASLNVATGASTLPEVDDALDTGYDLLEACAIADEDRAYALVLATTLDAYNNGDLGPDHCGDDEDTDDREDPTEGEDAPVDDTDAQPPM